MDHSLMRQIVNIDFGGASHEVKCTLALALQIEERTGRGVLAIGRELAAQTGRLTDALAVISCGISYKKYAPGQIADMAEATGAHDVMNAAMSIVAEFFKRPEGAEGNAEKPAKTSATTSR